MRGSTFITAFLFCVLLASTASGQATRRCAARSSTRRARRFLGVAVKLVNEATASEREAFSDETGAYQFAQVPPGTYQLTAELPGLHPVKTTRHAAGRTRRRRST